MLLVNFPTIFSYPLKICSMLVIIVVPSAIIPATSIAAPALKSVAITSLPFKGVLPLIMALLSNNFISAPIEFKCLI